MKTTQSQDKIKNFILKQLNDGCMDVWRLTVGDQKKYLTVLNQLIRENYVEREMNLCFITNKGKYYVKGLYQR
jgi:hypothetical protein